MFNRLRLGHSTLNGPLKVIGKHPSGMCGSCQEEETVEKVLLVCRQYEQEKGYLKEELRSLGCGVWRGQGL